MPTPLNAGQARGGRTGTAGRGTLRVLASTLPVVIGVVVAVFFLIRLVPGDPARANLGDQASDDAVADLRRELGLDQPLLTQFGDFLWNLLTPADTGDSLFYGISSRELVLSRAGLTLSLVAVAAVLTILIVVPLAILAATRRGSLTDHLVRIVPTVGLSMPIFWIGMLLALLFSHRLGWLPPGGDGDGLRSLLLPGLSIAITIAPTLIRSLRAQLVEVLDADFVTTARAAGLPGRRVLGVHVLRNAAAPTLSLFGLNIALMLGGTLVVERVFDLDGIGTILFEAAGNRDYPLVQAITLFSAIVVIVASLVTDLLVTWLDPRGTDR
jgi:peptide/nickel transport system permease protein